MSNAAAVSRFGASLRRRDGFIIVAVLWILLMLATLATIYSVYVGKSALALTANDAGLETELVASAGLELAAYQLLSPEKDERPTHGEFRVRLGRANLTVTFVSEAARIDLNEAPKPLLAGLFAVLGARGPDAERYADRVIGWRTEPKATTQDNEVSLYRAAGLSYLPRGAPFAHVNELWLVQGLPPALVERALPFVTVYSGQATVNVLDAAPEVLAALPEMTQDRLDNLLNRRETMTNAPESPPTYWALMTLRRRPRAARHSGSPCRSDLTTVAVRRQRLSFCWAARRCPIRCCHGATALMRCRRARPQR